MPDNIETTQETTSIKTKFCKHCAAKIPEDAVICTFCGRQVEELKTSASQPNVIINNSNDNTNTNVNTIVNTIMNHGVRSGRGPYNKWLALILCFFFGILGIHKFYEGKIGMGILYIFTLGLFGFGWLIDLIVLLFKPNPYYL